jgi:hypothetical protein
MRTVTRFLLFILFTFGVTIPHADAQVSGKVIDGSNGVPLAFVTIVIQGTNQGVYSDIDGAFFINSAKEGDLLLCSYVGFKSKEILIQQNQQTTPLVVELMLAAVELTEAVVLAGENPANRIVRLAMENKERNNPEVNCSFIYDSYNKFVFTAVMDSAVYTNPDLVMELDSSEQVVVKLFDEQHLLLMESVSERKFIPPNKIHRKCEGKSGLWFLRPKPGNARNPTSIVQFL